MTERCDLSSFGGPNVSTQSYAPLACTTSDRTTTIAVKTYRVTISPKGDVSDDVLKWVKKTYADNNKYVVVEKGTSGQRHVHMLLQFDKPKQKKDLRDVISRVIKKYHPDSILKYALVINTCYNMDWYDEYLRKEADVDNVDTDDFDPEAFRAAFPDQAAQTALQDATGRRAPYNVLADHEKRWIEWAPDNPSYESALSYLKWRINVQRDMPPMLDLRKRRQFAYCLHEFRNKCITLDQGDRQFHQKEFEGEVQAPSRI